jgi:hypothetical protein
LKAKKEKTYKGKLIKIISDLSAETLKGNMKVRNGIFQALKASNCQPKLLYPAKLCKINGEINPLGGKPCVTMKAG